MIKFLITTLILGYSFTAFAQLPGQITAGSYNLYGLRNPDKLKKDFSALNFVQVWAFQEVEGSFDERTANKLLALLPPGEWHLHLQKVNKLKGEIWEGQVIASRFPFESIEVLDLEHTDKKDRVALIANFKTLNGEIFSFANTDHEVDIFSIDFNDRKKQLMSLVDHFSQTNSKAIITGDFNTTGDEEEITATENIMLQANFQRIKSKDQDPTTFEKYFLKKELDHFFTRNIQTSLRHKYKSRTGSDHYPIYIHVKP